MIRTLLISLLVVGSTTTYSETLLEIYELAKQNDHEYKAAIARFNRNKEAATIARSQLLPQINGSASYGRTENEQSGSVNSDTTTDSLTYGIELQQALIDFNVLNNYRGQKLITAIAEVQLAADEQALIVRSATAYFDVLRAVDQQRTAEAEEKALATQLEQTRQRYEVGLVSINDVHETQAAFDSAVANRISADVSVGIALEALTIITGKNHNSIAPLKDDFLATLPQPNDKQAWIDAATNNNLLLQISKLDADAAVFSTKAARGNRLPRLTGTLSYSDGNSDRTGSGSSSDSVPINSETDSETTELRLNLQVPLYTGGNLNARQRQAAQEQIETRETYLLTQRQTLQQTRSLFLEVTTDIAQIKARKQAIVSSESALEATQAGYEAGTRDIVDVVTAQGNLFEAQRDYFTALYDYIINTLELKEVAGGLTVSDLQQLDEALQPNRLIAN